jgi:MYXO-CTERM domain-containing protein
MGTGTTGGIGVPGDTTTTTPDTTTTSPDGTVNRTSDVRGDNDFDWGWLGLLGLFGLLGLRHRHETTPVYREPDVVTRPDPRP